MAGRRCHALSRDDPELGGTMTFGEAVKSCFGKYATLRGRASRSEFWYFELFGLIMVVGFSALSAILGKTLTTYVIEPLYAIYMLGILLPAISVTVRRLHDRDKSGWWYWIALVPLVGAILLLVWFCQKGTDGDNRFGPDPLAGAGSAAAPLRPAAAG